MGLIGNRGRAGLPDIPDTTALDTSLPAPPPPGETQRPAGFFGRLGQIDWGSTLLGGLADGIAMWGGAKPGYASAMAEGRDWQRELAKAKILASLKDDDSPYIKDAKAIGLQPGTPAFARWVTRMRSAPRVVQTDQGIYNMDTDNYGLWGGDGGAPTGPQPGTVQDGYVFLGGDPSKPESWRKQ